MKLLLAAVAALALGGPAFAQAGHDMSKMPGMGQTAAAGAQGAGVIKKLDAKGGSVTLQHGPIAALGWPAMTMAFKAAPDLVQSVKPGDKVAFDLTLKDGSGEITAITRQ